MFVRPVKAGPSDAPGGGAVLLEDDGGGDGAVGGKEGREVGGGEGEGQGPHPQAPAGHCKTTNEGGVIWLHHLWQERVPALNTGGAVAPQLLLGGFGQFTNQAGCGK